MLGCGHDVLPTARQLSPVQCTAHCAFRSVGRLSAWTQKPIVHESDMRLMDCATWLLLFSVVIATAEQSAHSTAAAAAADLTRTFTKPRGVRSDSTYQNVTTNRTTRRLSQLSEASGPVYSSLWGTDGSKFEPGHRMFDPSWAGYKSGRTPPVTGEIRVINLVQDFGAIADDGMSDSEALAAAVASVTTAGNEAHQFTVIYFPPGDYLLTTNITISKPIVLRGAGKDATRIVFNSSMEDLYPGLWDRNSDVASPWSFRNMLIDFKGEDSLYAADAKLADIKLPTIPGSRVISVSTTEGIEPGMSIRIVAKDPGDGSLIRYLFGDEQGTIEMNIADLVGKAQQGNIEGEDPVDPIRFVTRVSKVFRSSNKILLRRAIPYALQLKWSPAVMRFEPKLQNVGIEDMTLEHKWARYGGHFKEDGHNTIGFVKVSNCWARNLRIANADTAIAIESAHFCTMSDVELTVTDSRDEVSNAEGISCHHGLSIGHSADVLINGFQVLTRCEHDISWDWWTTHSVAANGWGIDLNNDMHRSAPHGNLISNVGCGLCTRPWFSGGAKDRGLNAGMKNTFWNLHNGDSSSPGSSNTQLLPGQATKPQQQSAAPVQQRVVHRRRLQQERAQGFSPPPNDWGLQLNFIGCDFSTDHISHSDSTTGALPNTTSSSSSSSARVATTPINTSALVVSAVAHPTYPRGSEDIISRELTAHLSQSAQDMTGTWLIEAPQQGDLLQPQDMYTAFRDLRFSRGRRKRPAALSDGMQRPLPS